MSTRSAALGPEVVEDWADAPGGVKRTLTICLGHRRSGGALGEHAEPTSACAKLCSGIQHLVGHAVGEDLPGGGVDGAAGTASPPGYPPMQIVIDSKK
ncbi:hypothetical protein AB0K21_12000 [Streptosporangium sp. NPDC049248]|uniref:hypothetical protein n=1 Tax=Streptosporangium sp. NPDC049248 TaxID=3155651 RepID=UPI00343C3A0A